MEGLHRIGLLQNDDFFLYKLINLRQTSTVEIYQRYFEMLQNLVLGRYPDLDDSFFVSCCINGLKDEIQTTVVSWCPSSVEAVFSIAYLKEYLISNTSDKNNLIVLPVEEQVDANDETEVLFEDEVVMADDFSLDYNDRQSVAGVVSKIDHLVIDGTCSPDLIVAGISEERGCSQHLNRVVEINQVNPKSEVVHKVNSHDDKDHEEIFLYNGSNDLIWSVNRNERSQVVEENNAATAGGFNILSSIQDNCWPRSYGYWNAMEVSARVLQHLTFLWEPGPPNSETVMDNTTDIEAWPTLNHGTHNLSGENFGLRSHPDYAQLDSLSNIFYLQEQNLVIPPILLFTIDIVRMLIQVQGSMEFSAMKFILTESSLPLIQVVQSMIYAEAVFDGCIMFFPRIKLLRLLLYDLGERTMPITEILTCIPGIPKVSKIVSLLFGVHLKSSGGYTWLGYYVGVGEVVESLTQFTKGLLQVTYTLIHIIHIVELQVDSVVVVYTRFVSFRKLLPEYDKRLDARVRVFGKLALAGADAAAASTSTLVVTIILLASITHENEDNKSFAIMGSILSQDCSHLDEEVAAPFSLHCPLSTSAITSGVNYAYYKVDVLQLNQCPPSRKINFRLRLQADMVTMFLLIIFDILVEGSINTNLFILVFKERSSGAFGRGKLSNRGSFSCIVYGNRQHSVKITHTTEQHYSRIHQPVLEDDHAHTFAFPGISLYRLLGFMFEPRRLFGYTSFKLFDTVLTRNSVSIKMGSAQYSDLHRVLECYLQAGIQPGYKYYYSVLTVQFIESMVFYACGGYIFVISVTSACFSMFSSGAILYFLAKDFQVDIEMTTLSNKLREWRTVTDTLSILLWQFRQQHFNTAMMVLHQIEAVVGSVSSVTKFSDSIRVYVYHVGVFSSGIAWPIKFLWWEYYGLLFIQVDVQCICRTVSHGTSVKFEVAGAEVQGYWPIFWALVLISLRIGFTTLMHVRQQICLYNYVPKCVPLPQVKYRGRIVGAIERSTLQVGDLCAQSSGSNASPISQLILPRSMVLVGSTFILITGPTLSYFNPVVFIGALVFFLWHIAWSAFSVGKDEVIRVCIGFTYRFYGARVQLVTVISKHEHSGIGEMGSCSFDLVGQGYISALDSHSTKTTAKEPYCWLEGSCKLHFSGDQATRWSTVSFDPGIKLFHFTLKCDYCLRAEKGPRSVEWNVRMHPLSNSGHDVISRLRKSRRTCFNMASWVATRFPIMQEVLSYLLVLNSRWCLFGALLGAAFIASSHSYKTCDATMVSLLWHIAWTVGHKHAGSFLTFLEDKVGFSRNGDCHDTPSMTQAQV